MGENRTEQFLQLEDQAEKLVDELERLRKETESYATASRTLDEASGRLTVTAQALDRLTGDLGTFVKAMGEAGLPQVLAKLDEQGKVLTKLGLQLPAVVERQEEHSASLSAIGTRTIEAYERQEMRLTLITRLTTGLSAGLAVALVLIAWLALRSGAS